MIATVAIDLFARSIRERLFPPGPSESRRVGLEVEMLPLLTDSGAPCPLEAQDGDVRSTLRLVRAFGISRGWREYRSSKGAPHFVMPNGWSLTFEPGGQLEVCTTATQHLGELIEASRVLVHALRTAARDAGIELACVGIDPHNGPAEVPLRIPSERYVAMTRYFERIGPSGVRMMRQTAATQVSLDGGADPGSRWRLLSDAAPYFTAIFANSPRYAGQDTGHRSFRQRCWRQLDPTRTGVPHAELAPCEAYTQFALKAIDMTRTAHGEYRSFAEWAARDDWTEPQWENHLTTLFPEVRPRGHLEVRSIDALAPELLGVPVVLLAGLVYDEPSAAEARALLSPCDEEMLNRAARCGLRDSGVAATAMVLAELALAGARRLGAAVLGGGEIERTQDFVSKLTARGLDAAAARGGLY